MKNIEIDDELYLYIVSNTQSIGEDASSILRRLLKLDVPEHQEIAVTSLDQNDKQALPVSNEPTIEHFDKTESRTKTKESVIDNNQETVFNFINKEELAMQRGAVGRFLLILAALYRAHPKQFGIVTTIIPKMSIRKIQRLYFAMSEEELTAHGSSTKPKRIPQTPFWVITNSNTTRKKMMLTNAATLLGYNEDDVVNIRELL